MCGAFNVLGLLGIGDVRVEKKWYVLISSMTTI